jgi:hypothetical protein
MLIELATPGAQRLKFRQQWKMATAVIDEKA